MAAIEGGLDQATKMIEPEAFLLSLRAVLPEVLAAGINPQAAPEESFVSRREKMLAQIRLVDPDAFKQLIEARYAKTRQQPDGSLTEAEYLDLFALKETLLDFRPQRADDPIATFKAFIGNFLHKNLLYLPRIVRRLQTSVTFARTNASDPMLEVGNIKDNEFANTILQFVFQRIKEKQQQ